MNRRITLALTSMALLFLPALLATTEIGLAQSNPPIGTWKLNLAKSKYMGAPPTRSATLNFSGEGQNLVDNVETVDAQGQTIKTVLIHI